MPVLSLAADKPALHPRAASLGPVVIAGVGPRFGSAAARFFADRARGLALIARNGERLMALEREIADRTATVRAFPCDLTDEREVQATVREILSELGTPSLLIYAAEQFGPGDVLTMSVPAFEESWRGNCLGAFIIGREVARAMVASGTGTIVFLGGTSSLIARPGYLNLAVGKFGLRALSHVMSRELGPRGVHVVHGVIDAEIAGANPEGPAMVPEHLVREILRLHEQPSDCWTSELDLRPSKERFWEHC